MDYPNIYKDQYAAIIVDSISAAETHLTKIEIEQLFKLDIRITKILSSIVPINNQDDNEILEIISKYCDPIPDMFKVESGLLAYISISLAAWLYPQYQEAGCSDKEAILFSIDFIKSGYDWFTIDEWREMFDKI